VSVLLEAAAAASAATHEHDAVTKTTFTRYNSQCTTKTHESWTGVTFLSWF